MKFIFSWFKQYFEISVMFDQIVEVLICIGFEVEGVENFGEKFVVFKIVKILFVECYLQVDKLQVLLVDVGNGLF